MNKTAFRNKIDNADEKDLAKIADEIMATAIPWFFLNNFSNKAADLFGGFRTYMADKFAVPATNVYIAGSALLGFSLSPLKNYKSFGNDSDIDIVIIDEKLYNKYWDMLFSDYSMLNLTEKNYERLSRNIFKRFVDTNDFYFQNKNEYLKLIKQTDGFKKDLQILYRFPDKIGYRIYRTYDDYKVNLIKNLLDLKRS